MGKHNIDKEKLSEVKLIGDDYVKMPLTKLVMHPDFSEEAMQKIFKILDMTTEELEALNFNGGK